MTLTSLKHELQSTSTIRKQVIFLLDRHWCWLAVINESAGSQKSRRPSDLTLLSLALTCNQSQPMLGSSAESEAYLENSSPEQWHWKVVSAQQREGGTRPFSDEAFDLWRSVRSPFSLPHSLLVNLSSSGSISVSPSLSLQNWMPALTSWYDTFKDDALRLHLHKRQSSKKGEDLWIDLGSFPNSGDQQGWRSPVSSSYLWRRVFKKSFYRHCTQETATFSHLAEHNKKNTFTVTFPNWIFLGFSWLWENCITHWTVKED